MKYFAPLLALSLLAQPTLADDYVAKSNDEGEFCARVEVATITGSRKVKKCRTIEEWKKAGYEVSEKKSQDAEA